MRLRAWLIAATAVLLLAGTAAVGVRMHRHETLKPPTLRIEQTREYVKIHVHNPNKHWGVYDQHVLIDLHNGNQGFSIIDSYGPDNDAHASATDRRVIHCCVIDRLPPGGDFTFTLWPTKQTVTAARIDLYPPIHWVYSK